MSQFVTLTIKKVIQETPSAVSLVFEVPAKIRSDFHFIPGQFITLKAKVNGQEVRRAYSLSSSPNDPDIKVSVKKIADGTFSIYANENLKAGDQLEVMVPEGKFKLQPQPNKNLNYMAFAAGSGITPIMSMIKTVLTEERNSKFVLIYGNKSSTETMFFKELLQLQSIYPNRLFLEFIYSRENTDGARFGRIDKSTVNFAVKNKFKDISFNDFYLCGPEAMITTVKEVLAENNVSNEAIHFELFTATETAKATNSGETIIHVVLDDEQAQIKADKSITLLDNVLKADMDAPYSCKGGVCCSCICRVVEGEANMPVNNLLTDAEVAEGLVLACQAYAISDSVKIDFDDA
ncbi:ferredoxin--NADP reductase [Aquimarina agarilytica]|uniref:ferredoxin--NADP reductase n=1 Tax=Aquimarina agarilytica TaxID=1087449 RepID=UPI0002892CF0|nr:ferredoxin--NADP reductase [Aquimarina agarilytica]